MKILFIVVVFGVTLTINNCLAEYITEEDAALHNNLFNEAIEYIHPYMLLVGGTPRKASNSFAQAEIKKGIQLLDRVTEINPVNWSAYWVKGKAYQALEDDKNSYYEFKKAYLLESNNSDVARELAMECLFLGKGNESVKVAKHACELNPEDAGLIANLGLAYLIDGDIENAFTTTKLAYDLNPKDKITRRQLLAIIEIKLGNRKAPKKLDDLYSKK